MSAFAGSDATFHQLLSSLWKIDAAKPSPAKEPYAGSSERVYEYSGKKTYNKDIHGVDRKETNPIIGSNKFEWDVPPYTVFERLEEGKKLVPAGVPSFKDYKSKEREGGEEMSNTELLEHVKAVLMSQGVFGFIFFHKLLIKGGNEKTKIIPKDKLNECLQNMGINLDEKSFDKLVKLFDMSNTNEVDYEEFYRTLVGELSLSRADFVEKVFRRLDKDGNGLVDARDVVLAYNPTTHPDVVSKKKMPKEILALFLDSFEAHLSIIVNQVYNCRKQGKQIKE